MPKRLSAMPKSLHAGRKVRLGGKEWVIQESYSERAYGSDKIYRTLRLVMTE